MMPSWLARTRRYRRPDGMEPGLVGDGPGKARRRDSEGLAGDERGRDGVSVGRAYREGELQEHRRRVEEERASRRAEGFCAWRVPTGRRGGNLQVTQAPRFLLVGEAAESRPCPVATSWRRGPHRPERQYQLRQRARSARRPGQRPGSSAVASTGGRSRSCKRAR